MEKKEELTGIYAPKASSAQKASVESGGKLSWQQQKEENARQRKRQNDLKKTENRISELEARDGEIDAAMAREEVFTNVAECIKLNEEKAAIAAELEQLYELWEELAE